MMITEDKLNEVRDRWCAMERRKEREYANLNGSWNGATSCANVPGGPFRFSYFCGHLQRCERIRIRFDIHCQRVERALASPLSRFVAGQQALDQVVAA